MSYNKYANLDAGVRYSFSSETGTSSALSTLDSLGLEYIVLSPSVIIVKLDDRSQYESVTNQIGRDLNNSDINCGFATSRDPNYTFNSIRDFGPNPTLLNNLDTLKYIYQNTSKDVYEVFGKFMDSLSKPLADDLVTVICGVDVVYISRPGEEDFNYIKSRLTGISIGKNLLLDAHVTIKELYGGYIGHEYYQNVFYSLNSKLPGISKYDIKVGVACPLLDAKSIVRALNVIIKDRNKK